MTGEPPPITQVVGGSHGMTVSYEHALALAADYAAAGERMRAWSVSGAAVLTCPDLWESAVLAPVRFAEAEAAVITATSGHDGILVESLAWEADALTIRVRVRATQLTDELVARAWDRLDYELGHAAGLALTATAPEWLGAAVLGGAALGLVWLALPPDVREALRDRTLEDVQEWLTEHPEVVQHAVAASGGLLDGIWDGLLPGPGGLPFGGSPMTPDVGDAAGLLGAFFEEGGHRTVRLHLTVPDGAVAPGDLPGLVGHLSQVNDLSNPGRPEHNGTIEIQTIRDGDGTVRHIVYLPGTDDLATTPWSQDVDVRDLGANLSLIAGQPTAYGRGVLDAMHQAGIRPEEPVALVGHSQGGMVAAALLAQQAHGDSPFSITTVVTAGSPTAQVDGFPLGTHVLSLENHGDVIPLLDGADNADSREQVTVRFDDHEASVGGNHALAHYLAGAAAVQASDDPSIRDQLTSLADLGFLGAAEGRITTSQVFQVTRAP